MKEDGVAQTGGVDSRMFDMIADNEVEARGSYVVAAYACGYELTYVLTVDVCDGGMVGKQHLVGIGLWNRSTAGTACIVWIGNVLPL